MLVDVVLCKDCRWRHTDDCPMYFEEEYTWDDDGYIERDFNIIDHTTSEGFCDQGAEKDDN